MPARSTASCRTPWPSAVELAIALAEETDSGDGIVSGSGVVVTGSVVTAGEARTLFGKDPQ